MRRRTVVHTSSPKWPTHVPTLHPPPFPRKPSKVLPQRFVSSKQIGSIPLPLGIMERIPVDRDQLIPISHALVATAKKLRATDDKRRPFWSQHPSPQMRLSIAALSSGLGIRTSIRCGSSQVILESIFPPYMVFVALSCVASEPGRQSRRLLQLLLRVQRNPRRSHPQEFLRVIQPNVIEAGRRT